ncbi:MAG TPA: glucose-1-phosphate adenylyltransferase [Saprospiraceae bacterium]|nr:glucose-1-phosphate adenylyltransferase [Saprospiraceae bacterium]
MISLILGGGAGTRLYPLTAQRSKPAVSIGGKYRLIDIPISNCLNSGLKRMFVLTQYNSASLNKHIKNTFSFDAFTHGFVDILAAEQTYGNDQWFQGTADAVRQSMHHLINHDYDYILILSGDQLYQMNFEEMANFHIEHGADLTIATIPVDARDAPSFGIMKVDQDKSIPRFIEKPSKDLLAEWESPVGEKSQKQKRNYLASMGIYIFNKKALAELFEENPNAVDFGKEIIPLAINTGRKVVSFEYDGYWTDIGNIRSFFEANLELTDDIPQFNLFDNRNIVFTHARMLPPGKFLKTMVDHALIADGAIVHASSVQRSIVGIRSRIGKNTVLKNTIMMGNDYFESLEEIVMNPDRINMGVGADSHIENCILDKNVRIGDNVKIIGEENLENMDMPEYTIVDGIIVVKKNAVIPSGSQIGYLKD